MATIAQLDVIYSANTRPLTRGLKDAKRQSKSTTKSIVRGAGRMARGFRGTLNSVVNLRSAIGVLAGSAGIGLLVRNQMKAIDSTAKFSDRLNIQVEEMTALHRITERSGSSKERLNKSLEAMSRRIADAAKGTGEAQDALKALNVDAKELNEMGLAQQFELISNRMQGVATANERASIAADLMSRQGIGLLTTMKSLDQDGLQPTIARLEETGEAFDRVDAAKVEQANDAITEMQGALTGVTTQLTIQLAPIITGVADRIRGASSEGRIFGNTMAESMEGTINAIGFMADSVEGVKRVFQLTGRVAALAFLGIQEGALVTADYIINWPTRAANDLVGILNKIPGMDISGKFGMSGLGKKVNSELQTVRRAVNFAQEDIQSILLEPMPSTAINQFVADTQAEIEKAQRDRGPIGIPSGGGDSEDEEQSKTDLFDSLLETTERVEDILAGHEERKKGIYRDSQSQLLNQHLSFLDSMEQAEKASGSAKLGIYTNALQTMTAAGATENKKMFEANKKAGIANAIVSTQIAAAKALEQGPYLGPALAAMITAAGMAKVSAIQSQSFSGGGGGSAPSMAGGTAAPPVTPVSAQGESNQPESTSVTVNIEGDDDRIMNKRQVRALWDELKEAAGDDASIGSVTIV